MLEAQLCQKVEEEEVEGIPEEKSMIVEAELVQPRAEATAVTGKHHSATDWRQLIPSSLQNFQLVLT